MNMYKLLKPGGTVLMGFLAFSPAYDIYEKLSKFSIYERYMKDVRNFISPYHHSEDPIGLFKSYLDTAGFQARHVEIRDQVYIYENIEQLKSKLSFLNTTFLIRVFLLDAVLSVNPFTKQMPESLQNQFIDDYIKLVEQVTENKFIDSSSKIISRYKLIVAVLTK